MSSRRKFRLCCLYLPLCPSLSLHSPPPHSLSPAIPSLPPYLPTSGLQRGHGPPAGLHHALPGRHSPSLPPSSLPLASREASPVTGLWQPSGIDQQCSSVAESE